MPHGAVLVESIEVFPVRVPRRGVFALQRGNSDQSSWFSLVRVTTRDGSYGWGECVTRVRSMHRVVEDQLDGVVVGRDIFDIEGLHRAIDQQEMLAVERLWHWNPLRAAIEMAFFDLQGKHLGLSVAQLIGGIRRERIPTVKNVGVGSPEQSAELAQHYVAAGYELLKVRVGADPRADEARLRAIREVVDDGIRIRLDANQAWAAPEAVAAIGRYTPYGLEAVEQPCAFWDVESNARVVQESAVPIISDEGFVSSPEARVLLSGRGADVLHAYIGKCGGIAPVMEIAAIARSFGARMTLGERVPLGISEAAHLQVAAALPELEFPCALAYDLNESDLLVESPRREGGGIHLPDGPGLGVDVDLELLERYRRDS
ncbi:mandelate racemase/muconate lactonizing enzyme family protein [Microbacterium sp. EST19A]|uniref:mandelate racemase/muconate lactonizing enzyme family protein n=1 Tax=Microbacterium sp. EST19A TaxID=2862681 RepID=UPI001CC08AFA|nr:mandelate racemase/muconate lactonizing enzyme family protein [Microbacterium sp. EST19A]